MGQKIGFKEADVVVGGQYHDLFYDNVVVKPRKFYNEGGYKVVEVKDGVVSCAWLIAHKDNIVWKDVGIFVELPISFKTVNAPSWLTNNTYEDENGDTQTHTLESYGSVREEGGTSLDGTMWVFKATVHKDLTLSQLNSLETFLGANPTATGMLTKETRDLLNGPDYKVPE